VFSDEVFCDKRVKIMFLNGSLIAFLNRDSSSLLHQYLE